MTGLLFAPTSCSVNGGTVDPDELDELAADLWRDARLRDMAPAEAAAEWLKPIAGGRSHYRAAGQA